MVRPGGNEAGWLPRRPRQRVAPEPKVRLTALENSAMYLPRLPSSFVFGPSRRPSRATSARRRRRLEAVPERLEDRCMLTLTTLQAAIPLGQLSTTPITENGTITSKYGGGDLYSFSATKGQTVEILLQYPGEGPKTNPNYVNLQYHRLGLYQLTDSGPNHSPTLVLPSESAGRIASDPALLNGPNGAYYGDPPRPPSLTGVQAPYIQYTFDNANSSANGLYYIYVDTAGGPGSPPTPSPLGAGSAEDPFKPDPVGNMVVPAPYTLIVQAQNPAPLPPTAVNHTATTTENQPVSINVLAGDSDPNGYPLRVTGVSSAAGGRPTNRPTGATSSRARPAS